MTRPTINVLDRMLSCHECAHFSRSGCNIDATKESVSRENMRKVTVRCPRTLYEIDRLSHLVLENATRVRFRKSFYYLCIRERIYFGLNVLCCGQVRTTVTTDVDFGRIVEVFTKDAAHGAREKRSGGVLRPVSWVSVRNEFKSETLRMFHRSTQKRGFGSNVGHILTSEYEHTRMFQMFSLPQF